MSAGGAVFFVNIPFGTLGNDSVNSGATKTTALVKLLEGFGTDTP